MQAAAMALEGEQGARLTEAPAQMEEVDVFEEQMEVKEEVEGEGESEEEEERDEEAEEEDEEAEEKEEVTEAEEEEEREAKASDEKLAHRDPMAYEAFEPDPRHEAVPEGSNNPYYPWKNWTRAFMSIWALIYKPPQRMLNSLLMVCCSPFYFNVIFVIIFAVVSVTEGRTI
jgi:hypothetical protein